MTGLRRTPESLANIYVRGSDGHGADEQSGNGD